MKSSIGTVFIFLGAVTLFYLLRTYSYLVDFLFVHWTIELIFLIGTVFLAVWTARRLDKLISASRFGSLMQGAAILLMGLFFTYLMFASHFYSEEYLKETGLEKVERLFELAEMDLDGEELREAAEEITFKENAFAYSLYGLNPNPSGAEELEVLDFKRRYNSYELLIGSGSATASYSFTRDGFGFKINGSSTME
ncbi:hypothetical protein DHX103_11590 [Planococcus sp. X10-3]|uniref:hypothetical protein n=1 Tax=Planococcus sp. X10-3 TaxID=3061240 RepID=UPI003BAE3B9E